MVGKRDGSRCVLLGVCWPGDTMGGFIRNGVSHVISMAFSHWSNLEAGAKSREAPNQVINEALAIWGQLLQGLVFVFLGCY